METKYRHTQVGWVILGSMGAALALVVGGLGASGMRTVAAVAGSLLLAMILLFGWLSVEVSPEELRARFGVGLIGKRISLGDVRTFSSVKNPWYWGWGIRLFPGGWLYNVSGFEAVEIALNDGRRYRIGTDDPGGLSAALREVIGDPAPVAPDEPAARPRAASKVVYLGLALVSLAIVGAVVALVGVQARPPEVAVTPTSVSVKSGFYGVDVPFAEVTAVTLEPSLPHVLRRTNGYAAAGSLRGHFDVEGLGKGQLYVETRHPPFVLVRTKSSYFFVNSEDESRTRDLHREIEAAWSKTR